MEHSSQPVTQMLIRWKSGDEGALEELIPILYQELRRVARFHLLHERPDHSFQSAALVNEVYLRLIAQKPFETDSRTHFVMVASRLMRQVLVDHARSRNASKRGAGQVLNLDTSPMLIQKQNADVIAVDEALTALAKFDERQTRIIELRFFGGLSNEEVSEALGISLSTVKREWNIAKAWLARELSRQTSDNTGAMAES